MNWGVLYYAFAVLLLPVQHALGVPGWVVTGAFSLALFVSAMLAPKVGRWCDRGHAARAIVGGGIGGTMLLGVLALAPSPLTLYLTWAGLGVCMAASLYEPAFALVTRAHDSTEARLRALAIVTLCGGLASTVFVPLTDRLVTWTGWRGAVAILAGLLGASTATTAVAVRRIAMATPRVSHPKLEAAVITTSTDVRVLALVFGMSSFVSSSFIANLVPALGERGLPPASAALLGGLFGAMQLPGRALMLSRRVHLSGDTLLVLSFVLQAGGLISVAVLPTTAAAAIGVMTFAAGSGLTTLARPHLVQTRVALDQVGWVNGRLARAQQLSRAAGPVVVSAVAMITSHAIVLACLGLTLAALAWRMGTGPRAWSLDASVGAATRLSVRTLRRNGGADPYEDAL